MFVPLLNYPLCSLNSKNCSVRLLGIPLKTMHSFTCYVVNRVEANPKPPNFVWVIALDTPP